jgi:hypothetical protein
MVYNNDPEELVALPLVKDTALMQINDVANTQ